MVQRFNGSFKNVVDQVNASEMTDAQKAFVLAHLDADGDALVNVHVASQHGVDERGVCAGVTVTVHKAE
jgi:hypothetical protein